MTGWDDLPNEMKSEVFQYLKEYDRQKIARCYLKAPLNGDDIETLHFERQYHTVFLNSCFFDYQCFNVYINTDIISFQQNSDGMWDISYNGDCICERVKCSNNMIFKFFHGFVERSKDTLRKLKITDVFYTIRDASISNFPKLEELDITTCNKSMLYCLMSKSANIKKLVVRFTKPDEPTRAKETKFQMAFLKSVKELHLFSDDLDVTKNVLSRIISTDVFNEMSNSPLYTNQEQFDIIIDSDRLITNWVMKDHQFSFFSKHFSHIECDGRNIDAKTILKYITSNNFERKHLVLKNIEYDVIQKPLDLGPRVRKKYTTSYRIWSASLCCEGYYEAFDKVLDITCGPRNEFIIENDYESRSHTPEYSYSSENLSHDFSTNWYW